MRSPEDHETDADELIRLGTIATVDLGGARCTVRLDEAAETGPVRWIEWRAGATRSWSPPTVGEQVVLLCPAGEIAGSIALRGLVCEEFPPAGNEQIDLMEFADGAVVSYNAAAHEMKIILPAGATIAMISTGGVSIEGDVSIEGTLSASGDITTDGNLAVEGSATVQGDVSGEGKSLANHTHPGVMAGGSMTGPPA